MSSPFFSFFSLGGIGEIGLNSYVFDFGDETVIVDAGMSLPDNNSYGIGIILPDMTHIKDIVPPLKGMIFTHGHEDHTGAYPYYKETLDAPVFAPPFAVELINQKLAEFSKEPVKNPVLIKGGGSPVQIGGRVFTFFKTRHSIPQSYGFYFNTPWGYCIFTSDFKSIPDLSRLPERPFILFADSTNAEEDEQVDESKIDSTFDRIFKTTSGAVIATTFSSHIHRVRKIIKTAQRHGRKIFFAGRNLISSIEISLKLKLLKPFKIENWDDINKTPRNEIVIITTGTQGERFSSLNLIAHGNFRGFKIQKNDSVIISSSIIPGNERNIYSMLNRLSEKEAAVYYSKTSNTHTSGHSSKKEIIRLIKTLNPRYVIPIHGEHRHLLAYKKLAVKAGVPDDSVIILKNGLILEASDGTVSMRGEHRTGKIFIDAKTPVAVSVETIKDRKKLSEDGFITAIVDIGTRRLTGVQTMGVTDDPDFKNTLSEHIWEQLGFYMTQDATDYEAIKESVTQLIKVFTKKHTGKKPAIIVYVAEGKCL